MNSLAIVTGIKNDREIPMVSIMQENGDYSHFKIEDNQMLKQGDLVLTTSKIFEKTEPVIGNLRSLINLFNRLKLQKEHGEIYLSALTHEKEYFFTDLPITLRLQALTRDKLLTQRLINNNSLLMAIIQGYITQINPPIKAQIVTKTIFF